MTCFPHLGGTPEKIWSAAHAQHLPYGGISEKWNTGGGGGTLNPPLPARTQGGEGFALPTAQGGGPKARPWGHTPRQNPPPYPPSPTLPPTSTSKGVVWPRGHRLPHRRTSSTRVVRTGAIICRHLRLCSCTAGSAGDGSGVGPISPFTCCTLGEGLSTLTTRLPLPMWGGGRCGPPSYLGGGGPREGANGGARHPQLDLVKGYLLLAVGLQGEGKLQHRPPPPSVHQEHVSHS